MASRNDWGTPWGYFKLVEKLFGPMDIDVCASKQNTKVPQFYFDIETNGLVQDWTKYSRLWLNPPYSERNAEPGRKKPKPVIQHWLQKAYESTHAQAGNTVFALVPNDPSTKWWMNWAMQAQHILFNCNGRLRFDDAKGSPTFTTALLIYSRFPLSYAAQALPPVGFIDWKKGIIVGYE